MAKKSKAQDETQETKGNGASETTQPMPLFYQKPQPLDSQRHRDLGLTSNATLAFAAKVNAVPVNLIEMPQLCHFYPIGFSPDENATPVALLGLRDNENLFVNEDGSWLSDTYIPAYIRRYPFIFSEMPESDQLSLCIDMDSDMVTEKPEQPFFDEEGNPTQLTQNALEFCKSYHAAAQQTLEFGKAMADNGILVDRQAEITLADGRKINFSGFRIIDEQKLGELDDKVFLDWRQKGWLPFVYAQLFSGGQWQRLTRLLNKKLEAEK